MEEGGKGLYTEGEEARGMSPRCVEDTHLVLNSQTFNYLRGGGRGFTFHFPQLCPTLPPPQEYPRVEAGKGFEYRGGEARGESPSSIRNTVRHFVPRWSSFQR